MKQKDLIKLLEINQFILVRQTKHLQFKHPNLITNFKLNTKLVAGIKAQLKRNGFVV